MAPTLMNVPIGKIKPDPDQPRKTLDMGEFASLVQSVKQHGITTPLTLRKNGAGYIVIAGERRLRAAKELKLKDVPALIVDAEQADTQAVLALVENLVREDLNPIEEGDAYLRLVAAGLDTEAIAMQVSRPVDRIVDRVKLASLPASARKAVVEGRVQLQDVRAFTGITDPAFAEAVCFAADISGDWHRGPWHVFFNMDRIDPQMRTVECKECNGEGYDENEQLCKVCRGSGSARIKDPKAKGFPKFFAWALWPNGTPLADLMLKQLTKPAQKIINEQAARADVRYQEIVKKRSWEHPLHVSLDAQEIIDVAVAGGYAIDLDNRRYVVTDPAFVSEYLPAAYTAAVDEYVKAPSEGRRAGAKAKAKTAAEQREADERAKERVKAAKQRDAGRMFNEQLGRVISTKLGEVPVTAAAMKLLAHTILDLTKHAPLYNPGNVGGEGHALYHRFTRVDWPTTKAGEFKFPRKSDERATFVKDVYKQAEREIDLAKTPEQALGALTRFLAHGLVDLRGLPKADLEGLVGFRAQRAGWRSFILGRLPKALRGRVPAANGIKGNGSAW